MGRNIRRLEYARRYRQMPGVLEWASTATATCSVGRTTGSCKYRHPSAYEETEHLYV